MDNIAAFTILKKQKFTKEDRKFLRTHLETYEYLLSSAFTESYYYKDILDNYYNQDSRLMSIKENVIVSLENLFNILSEKKKQLDDVKEVSDAKIAITDLLNVLQHNELLNATQKE